MILKYIPSIYYFRSSVLYKLHMFQICSVEMKPLYSAHYHITMIKQLIINDRIPVNANLVERFRYRLHVFQLIN